MKVITTYNRPNPDTMTGHKIVLTQVYYSMDEREIDALEELFKAQYNSGTAIEYKTKEGGTQHDD